MAKGAGRDAGKTKTPGSGLKNTVIAIRDKRMRMDKPNRAVWWFASGFVLIAASVGIASSTALRADAGMTCFAAVAVADESTSHATQGVKSAPRAIPSHRVSVFAVPLVCPTAPQIGCGSHAKPILVALEQQAAVAEAWLDRSGTRMVLVWKANAKPAERVAALSAVRNGQQFEARELDGAERKQPLQNFLSGESWYRGRDVDRLSVEEAGIMSARLVRRIQGKVALSEAKAATLGAEFTDVFKRRLLGVQDASEATGEAQVLKVLEKHLDAQDVTTLKETLPHNLRPLPGEQ